MPFPTVTVTPGSGQTVNTLPNAGQATSANSLPVVLASDQSSIPVTGTFYQATQPVSIASGSIANTAFGISGTLPAFASTPTVNIGTAPSIAVTGTFWQTTQPVSFSSTQGVNPDNVTDGATQIINGASLGTNAIAFTQNMQGYSSFEVQCLASTTGNYVFEHSNDNSNWDLCPVYQNGGSIGQSYLVPSYYVSGGTGSSNSYRGVTNRAYLRMRCSSAGTLYANASFKRSAVPLFMYVTNTQYYAAGTPSGSLTGPLTMGAAASANPSYTDAKTGALSLTTTGSLRSDITTIGGSGQLAAAAAPNGATVYSLGTFQATALSNTDQNGTAFAGSGSVLGTTVASSKGSGAVISAEVNVSALTLGTASAVYLILQESTGGTNFTDIWVSDPFTTTGIQRMPAIPVSGKRRWRAFSVGGTSTTVTVTITSLELPAGYILTRQGRDAYASTNPLALMYNSTALAASNFVLGTVSTATTPFFIEGTKNLTAFMTLAGSPTVTTQPVVGLQLSMDGSNWYTVSDASMTAAGNGTYMIAAQSVGGAKFARLGVTTAASYSAGSYTISNIGVNAVN